MKVAFTICSNNYLAQAKTFGDSLMKNNPDYIFYIGLVDRLSQEINYKDDIKHEIILVEDIGIIDFDKLWKKYDIIELNTCVKPMFFKYLFNKHKDVDSVFYFDPDIMIFDSLQELENELDDKNSILLTPHIISPIPIDGKNPFENSFLNYGIYNLGFLGLKNDSVCIDLLNWWQDRTVKFGFSKAEIGLFVDQLWFNLVPLFFNKVKISRHLGYNMAPWNLHERLLSDKNGRYYVNKTFNLVFFHFSNYKYSSPGLIAKHYNRYQLSDLDSLKKIYNEYDQLIVKNNVQKLSKVDCYYVNAYNDYRKELNASKQKILFKNIYKNKKSLIKHYMKKIVPDVFVRMYKAI